MPLAQSDVTGWKMNPAAVELRHFDMLEYALDLSPENIQRAANMDWCECFCNFDSMPPNFISTQWTLERSGESKKPSVGGWFWRSLDWEGKFSAGLKGGGGGSGSGLRLKKVSRKR